MSNHPPTSASAAAAPAPASSSIPYQKLLHDVTLTKNCRFYASRRIAVSAWSSLLAITALSVVNISMSIISIVFGRGLTDIQVRIVGVVIVIISVYLIVLDLLVAARGFDTRRFLHDRSAKSLLDLRNEMLLHGDTPENNKRYQEKYSHILAEYHENHEDIDFRYARTFDQKSNRLDFYGALAILSYRFAGLKLISAVLLPVIAVLWVTYKYFGAVTATIVH
jgi:hypothetical protein